jgi:ubiquinone/menaquinone biosynthesis C-methylase UbiE
MTMDEPAVPHYVLGRSEAESQRLIRQATFLRPSTERVFRKAGIAEGMHVLDLGCGAGDVSFLAADLVGPTGSVVGIDVDPLVLAVARDRAHASGLTTVTFDEGAVDSFTTTNRFDAVVGRFVLIYQADPVASLRHVSSLVKNGGLIVVQEPDFRVGITTAPPVALWQQVQHWIAETFRRGGVHYDIGGRLYHVFRQAGLPGPAILEHIAAGGGPAMRPYCDNSAGIVRSLLPRMEQFGIATIAAVQVDTLADRLEQEMCAAECQITYIPIVGAWTTKDASYDEALSRLTSVTSLPASL